jgi:hypothetical protein
VFTASYAAAPHLVAFAARVPAAERARALHLVAAIEVGRRADVAPAVPDDLADGYRDAVARVPALVGACIEEPWDAGTTQALAGVLAIAKGHPHFGNTILSIEPLVACPVCGAMHAPAGWAADERR